MKYNPKSKKIDQFEGFLVTKAKIFNQVSERFQWLPYTREEMFLRDFKHTYVPHENIHIDVRFRLVKGKVIAYTGSYFYFRCLIGGPGHLWLKSTGTQIFPSIH